MGIISKMFGWLNHPLNDNSSTVKEWFAGLLVVIILAFLWNTVLREIE